MVPKHAEGIHRRYSYEYILPLYDGRHSALLRREVLARAQPQLPHARPPRAARRLRAPPGLDGPHLSERALEIVPAHLEPAIAGALVLA